MDAAMNQPWIAQFGVENDIEVVPFVAIGEPLESVAGANRALRGSTLQGTSSSLLYPLERMTVQLLIRPSTEMSNAITT